jgi:hypothetical protein
MALRIVAELCRYRVLKNSISRCYVRVSEMLDLPLDQFEKEWDRVVKEQAGNPIFTWVFLAVHKVRLAQLRAEVRRALLSAALAVQIEGREALKNHADPVVGGPFDYEAFEGGFELRSRWTQGLRNR